MVDLAVAVNVWCVFQNMAQNCICIQCHIRTKHKYVSPFCWFLRVIGFEKYLAFISHRAFIYSNILLWCILIEAFFLQVRTEVANLASPGEHYSTRL